MIPLSERRYHEEARAEEERREKAWLPKVELTPEQKAELREVIASAHAIERQGGSLLSYLEARAFNRQPPAGTVTVSELSVFQMGYRAAFQDIRDVAKWSID